MEKFKIIIQPCAEMLKIWRGLNSSLLYNDEYYFYFSDIDADLIVTMEKYYPNTIFKI